MAVGSCIKKLTAWDSYRPRLETLPPQDSCMQSCSQAKAHDNQLGYLQVSSTYILPFGPVTLHVVSILWDIHRNNGWHCLSQFSSPLYK